MPDYVSRQITDAVTQTNVKVVGEAPAMAMGMLYQSFAQALANAAHNATAAQHNANMILQATTTQGVALLFGLSTSSTAVGTRRVLRSR